VWTVPIFAEKKPVHRSQGRKAEKMRILFIGDIVGRPGRTIVINNLNLIREEQNLDLVIANAENASGGVGLSPSNAHSLLDSGIDLITGGNHIFQHKEYETLFETYPQIIRPANYPPTVPGKGNFVIHRRGSEPVGVINLIGRTFMEPLDCPFRTVDSLLDEMSDRAKIIVVDFHAEATSEKVTMGCYLNGRVSMVVGTHTHVQTADERILDKGTAYITDVGMTGPSNAVIGVDRDAILKRFLTGLPVRFTVAKGPCILNSVIVDVDPKTGKAISIERFNLVEEFNG
jgi:metallophosphoesterase (TIGR00282 family)